MKRWQKVLVFVSRIDLISYNLISRKGYRCYLKQLFSKALSMHQRVYNLRLDEGERQRERWRESNKKKIETYIWFEHGFRKKNKLHIKFLVEIAENGDNERL